MNKKYKAWIPNVSGNLSFSNIKGTKIPGRASHPRTFNHLSDDSKGCIYSLQLRNLSDAIFSRFDKGGNLYYFLLAEIENAGTVDEALVGHIYTYPKEQVTPSAQALIVHFYDSCLDIKYARHLENEWKSLAETVDVSFKLTRDGFAELKYEGQDALNEHTFVFETYSFLKDLVHAHKFHRYDEDAIVVPFPIRYASDTSWIERTLRNLHKSVVNTYRNAHYSADLLQAVGKLSYLDCFQSAALRKFPNSLREDQKINLETLRASLEAKIEVAREAEQRKSLLLQFYFPLFLTVLAFIITMTQLLQMPCVEGLTALDECKLGGEKFSFKVEGHSIAIASHILNNWYDYLKALIFTTLVVIGIAHFPKIGRKLNQQIGHGFNGWVMRVTLGLAVSEKWGRVLASTWIFILVSILLWLCFIALGLIRLYQAPL